MAENDVDPGEKAKPDVDKALQELGEPANDPLVSRKPTRKAIAAAKMRVSGASPAEIADILGYATPAHAQAAIDAALAGIADPDMDFKALRRLRNAQLEAGLKAFAPRALHGTVLVPDPKDSTKTVRVQNEEQVSHGTMYLRFLDRLIRLQGLDAPQVMALVSPKSVEFEEVVGLLVAATRGEAASEADIFSDDEVVYYEPDDDGTFQPPAKSDDDGQQQ